MLIANELFNAFSFSSSGGQRETGYRWAKHGLLQLGTCFCVWVSLVFCPCSVGWGFPDVFLLSPSFPVSVGGLAHGAQDQIVALSIK